MLLLLGLRRLLLLLWQGWQLGAREGCRRGHTHQLCSRTRLLHADPAVSGCLWVVDAPSLLP
jgi:hypothetical protein